MFLILTPSTTLRAGFSPKGRREVVESLLLLLLTGWLFGYRLGALGFWNKHTESRRAEVAREMVVSGDWVVPHLNGKVFPTKPPLAYWLMALSFRWTDRVDEWAARLPSAICGWLTVFVTYGIGRRLWGSGAGLFSGTFLATGVLFQWYARSAGLDMVLTCATTLTLWCFINSQVIETQRQSRWMILGGVFLALATLTKGPLGLSVPLLPIAGWLVLGGRQRHPSRFKTWLWALLAFAVVLVPWCVSILQRAPNIFEVASQEIRENIVRPLTSQYQHGSHHEPWYYYLGTLGAFAPWSLFLPAALWEWGSAVRARAQRPMDSGLLFVWLWFGLNLIVFSLAPQKKPYAPRGS
ncbi:MAG: glycosyltransferase family 39 protein [Elusimicrobia bacterium]|nr:glycosyltransferase family 39 protein [Elusimicrobiota bacterium]